MKISKRARARLKLMTAAEKKKITSAARTLFDFGLISTKRVFRFISSKHRPDNYLPGVYDRVGGNSWNVTIKRSR